MSLVFLCIILLAAVSSCSTKDPKPDVAATPDTVSTIVPVASSSPFNPLGCETLAGFPRSMDILQNKTREVLNGDDSCVLSLMDSIYLSYIATGDEKFMEGLKSIGGVSDGYVGEYLMDVMVDVFMKRPVGCIQFLHRSDTGELRQQLIWGMNRMIFNPSGIIISRKEIDSVVDAQLRGTELSRPEKRYLSNLRKDWLRKED